jgi:esterase/lipase superfamily enzyme
MVAVAGANERLQSVLAVILALACSSCATRPLQGVLVPTVEAVSEGTRIPILIATTRQRSSDDAGEMFNSERADATSYAKIVVSIPPDDSRKIGEIQWPVSPPGNPRQDFVTVSAEYSTADVWRDNRQPRQTDPPKPGDDLHSWIQQSPR